MRGSPRRQAVADALGLVVVLLVLLDLLRPSLLLLSTITAGGDTPCHYPTAVWFHERLLPEGGLHGRGPGAHPGPPRLVPGVLPGPPAAALLLSLSLPGDVGARAARGDAGGLQARHGAAGVPAAAAGLRLVPSGAVPLSGAAPGGGGGARFPLRRGHADLGRDHRQHAGGRVLLHLRHGLRGAVPGRAGAGAGRWPRSVGARRDARAPALP